MPSQDKFRESMEKFGIDPKVIAEVNRGFESLTNQSKKLDKAMFFKRATDIFDEQVDPALAKKYYEWNACCKGGARLKASKAFAAENKGLTLEEKLAKIPAVPNMGKPELNTDGTITVHAVYFWQDGCFVCACPNFHQSGLTEAVSKTYCHCCAGHFQFHYQVMLGVKLSVLDIVSCPLDSDGKNPCVIKLGIVGK